MRRERKKKIKDGRGKGSGVEKKRKIKEGEEEGRESKTVMNGPFERTVTEIRH